MKSNLASEQLMIYKAQASQAKLIRKAGIVIRFSLTIRQMWNYMSLTLRDAQHLCWKSFKKINDMRQPKGNGSWTPIMTANDLIEEANKIVTKVKIMEEPKTKEQRETSESLAAELSDLLYLIFVIAQHYSIELEESFLQTMNDRIISKLGS